MAVIVVMALVSILLIYVACNLRTLSHLGHELKLLEQRQLRRLEQTARATNAPVTVQLSPPAAAAR